MATDLRLSDTLASNVRAEMGRQRLSIQQLSRCTGLPRMNLARSLGGHRAFTVDELQILSDELDVPIDSLLTPAPHVVSRSLKRDDQKEEDSTND